MSTLAIWIILLGVLVLAAIVAGFFILYFLMKTAVRNGTQEALSAAGLGGKEIRSAVREGMRVAMLENSGQFSKEKQNTEIPLQPPPNFRDYSS